MRITTEPEFRKIVAQAFSANVRRQWFMVKGNGKVWATSGAYTFDDAMRRFPSSTPVFALSPYQSSQMSAFRDLRRGLKHLRGE